MSTLKTEKIVVRKYKNGELVDTIYPLKQTPKKKKSTVVKEKEDINPEEVSDKED